MPLSGQNALLMLKQKFGSLRSYLEKQHNHFDLSFPEDISPDFIVSLRIKGIDDDEIDSEDDDNDIEEDEENNSNESNDNDNDNNDFYHKKESLGSEGNENWASKILQENANFDEIDNIYDIENEMDIVESKRNTVNVNVGVNVGRSFSEYERMTVKDLKNVLREYSLPLSGSKEQIIERLLEYQNTLNLHLNLRTKTTDVTVQNMLQEMVPRIRKSSGSSSSSSTGSISSIERNIIDVDDRYVATDSNSYASKNRNNDDVIRIESNKLISSRVDPRSSPLSVVASAAAASDDEWTIDRIVEMLKNSENEMVCTHLRGPCCAISFHFIS